MPSATRKQYATEPKQMSTTTAVLLEPPDVFEDELGPEQLELLADALRRNCRQAGATAG